MAVLMTAARYGRSEAHLTVAKLVYITKLSKRTVTAALADLIKQGLVERTGRYGKLRVPWLDGEFIENGTDSHATPSASPNQAGSASMCAPPDTDEARTGGASTCAPRRCKHLCTSPTSIISLLDTDSSKGLFSDRQAQTIADVLVEATDLLGGDVGQLTLKDTYATRLGLPPSTTYAEALKAVIASGNRKQARDFTGAVLALRRDVRVQGLELVL